MKSIVSNILLALGLFLLGSCASSGIQINPQKVQELIQSKNFRFVAQRANPTNLDVVNILNSLPNYSANRVLNLDPGYGVNFSSTEIKTSLPYFGRSYVAQFGDTSKNGYNLTLKNFSVDASKSTKKKTILNYSINDSQEIQQIIIEIYPNGRAYVSINSQQRQPISYDGYITDLPVSNANQE